LLSTGAISTRANMPGFKRESLESQGNRVKRSVTK
jgi:hypothetical protein